MSVFHHEAHFETLPPAIKKLIHNDIGSNEYMVTHPVGRARAEVESVAPEWNDGGVSEPVVTKVLGERRHQSVQASHW